MLHKADKAERMSPKPVTLHPTRKSRKQSEGEAWNLDVSSPMRGLISASTVLSSSHVAKGTFSCRALTPAHVNTHKPVQALSRCAQPDMQDTATAVVCTKPSTLFIPMRSSA
jgi:hypothetical protein